MQLFLILASCKGHSPLQQLVMLTLSCLCSSNSRPPPHYWSWEYRKETACWPNAGDPPPHTSFSRRRMPQKGGQVGSSSLFQEAACLISKCNQ